jgi:hypothetical protein
VGSLQDGILLTSTPTNITTTSGTDTQTTNNTENTIISNNKLTLQATSTAIDKNTSIILENIITSDQSRKPQYVYLSG